MTNLGTLYLIPAPLADTALADTLPQGTLALIPRLRHFVVEELRTARRYLSKAGHKGNIDALSLFVLNEHTKRDELEAMLLPMMEGNDLGLLSEAGLPAVADPGALLVALAHQKGIKVMPLTGPCSLMLALMASGLNGQSFAFAGYLPVQTQERKAKIRQLEKLAVDEGQTQIFIETPYRNTALFSDLLGLCAPHTKLCVAANLTANDAFVATKTVGQWRRANAPQIHKVPVVFVLGRE
ncbi:MAG: SAM-dependent methyltransferase [Bacteroidales bacterium]|nr:SAM-dependent methyltransferase [Bacteroidales bacterium]